MKTILLGKALRMMDAHHPSIIQKKGMFVVKTLQKVSKTQASIPSSTSDLCICWV